MSKPIVGISTGDLNGIGLETIIKVFSDQRMLEYCTPVLFASNKVVNYYKKMNSEYPLNFTSIKRVEDIKQKNFNVFNCWEEDVTITPGVLNENGGIYAIKSLEMAVEALKNNSIDTLVTAPIDKSNTQLPNFQHPGHTPYLKEVFEANDVVMMLYADHFRVALVTEHVPISLVPQHISQRAIIQKAQILNESLIKDFGISKPKIAILGLNPHAGDNGLLGLEEEKIIKPAIDQLMSQGILAFGPYSADGYFANHHFNKFDATLAMYHDQGLIPFKTIAGMSGVNYTCGLPKVRTSPDHGVAFDIAGKRIANEESLREAVFESIKLFKQRNVYLENTANPLVKTEIPKEK